MILFFHFLCLLARYIVINFSKSICQRKEFSGDRDEEDAVKNLSRSYLQNLKDMKPPVYQNKTLKFFPPIYIQRYETVVLILQNFADEGIIHKVVDFGCAELGLFPYLKNIEKLSEILEVDINEELLKRSAYRAAPLTSDYLMSKGTKPLDVYLLAGSVADYDDHLAGCDSVICIELIEHLPADVFYKMPYNIFHRIKPKVAIFTTPNADFNALFPNFEGMRHDDHKFEWSRKEFYLWTQDIIFQYPEYSVRFYGVGAGPEGTENLGCCSQVAVFTRSDDFEQFSTAREELGGFHRYKLIEHFKYPVFVDTRTVEEKVIHEIQYQLSYLITLPNYFNFEENESQIPLSLLKEYVKEFGLEDDELLNILMNNGMNITRANDLWYLIVKESELNLLDTSFDKEELINEDIAQSFCAEDSRNFEENWDTEEEFYPEDKVELTNFQTAMSLEESNMPERMKYIKEEYALVQVKNKTQSLPACSSKLNQLVVTSGNLDDVEYYPQRPELRKILQKTLLKESKENLKNYVCQPFRTISKFYSLDSCIDNNNSQMEFYLIPAGHISLQNIMSYSSEKNKRIIESGSSIDQKQDSGCLFSYSSADNLTQELVSDSALSRSLCSVADSFIETSSICRRRRDRKRRISE